MSPDLFIVLSILLKYSLDLIFDVLEKLLDLVSASSWFLREGCTDCIVNIFAFEIAAVSDTIDS